MIDQPSIRKQATPEQKRNAVIALAALFFLIVFANAFLGTTEKAKDESSAQTILTGSMVATNQGYAGCRRIEDTDKFTALLAANDSTAAMKFLDQADCRLIEAGARGEVEEVSLWHAAICVRQAGQPFCLWMPEPIVSLSEMNTLKPRL